MTIPREGADDLRIVDLTLRYGAVSALRGVSLTVPSDGIVALLGSNGAGKTSLLRAICGTFRFHGASVGGSVRRGDHELTRMTAAQIVRSGVVQVPEGRRVFPAMSVQDNLLSGHQRGAETRRSALHRMYELFPLLGERRAQAAGLLSGGEQQLLAIARALMASPRIILLDEPSLGLAPKAVGRVMQVVRDIHAAGTGVLLVEQNAEMALQVATDVTVLTLGGVALSGRTSDEGLRDRVRELYVHHREPDEAGASRRIRRRLEPWRPR